MQTFPVFEQAPSMRRKNEVHHDQDRNSQRLLRWPERFSQDRAQYWQPISLSTYFLVGIAILSALLITAIQLLLQRSLTKGSLISAANINELTLRQSFPFLYLPTIIAVGYAFLWTWIDLDVKRLEPFHQLSKGTAVQAKTSLLLQYPVEFVAAVPIKAFRFGHWNVFIASIASLIASWGLTPAQSGIFTRSVNITSAVNVAVASSTSYTPLELQQDANSAQYAISASNIIWLNETLPSFMTREYALAPFGTNFSLSPDFGTGVALSGTTRKYFVNITCEAPTNGLTSTSAASSWGCSSQRPRLRDYANNDTTKIYDALYVGYFDPYSDSGPAAYSLYRSCPLNATDSFLVQFSKALAPVSDFYNMHQTEQYQNAQVTMLYCRPFYWVQDVYATVSLPDLAVLDTHELAAAAPLPLDAFNQSNLEIVMNQGLQQLSTRTDFPTEVWPDQAPYLASSPLNVGTNSKMSTFAVSALQLPMDEYLNPDNLRLSYEAAYRILFARHMAAFLVNELDPSTEQLGQMTVQTQGIVTVPEFALATEIILGVLICFALALLCLSRGRSKNLHFDPGTISSLMSLTGDSDSTLEVFGNLDQASKGELHRNVSSLKLRMRPENERVKGKTISFDGKLEEDPTFDSVKTSSQTTDSGPTTGGVRPIEFSFAVGGLAFAFLALISVAIAILYYEALSLNGLPLVSERAVIRQLFENHIPTAIATFIGPMWLVLNRLLCMLQPFETLKHGSISAAESLSVGYDTAPPQFALLKAFRRGHYLLAAVSAMTIIADILPVAFSGLFYEAIVNHESSVNFDSQYKLQFAQIGNDTLIPNDRLPGRGLQNTNLSPLYLAVSNITAGTPLPAWTDDQYVYMPFLPAVDQQNSSWLYLARTSAFGATLNCSSLQSLGGNFSMDPSAKSASLTVSLPMDNGVTATCVSPEYLVDSNQDSIEGIFGWSNGAAALELNNPLDSDGNYDPFSEVGQFCREHFFSAWIRANTSSEGDSSASSPYDDSPLNITSQRQTIIVCRPQFVATTADIIVDSKGRVQQVVSVNIPSDATDSVFTGNSSSNLKYQTNIIGLSVGAFWHSDAFPSDFNNYLIEHTINSSRFIDYMQPPPTVEEAGRAFAAIYAKLFAITIGTNMEPLFVSSAPNTKIQGTIIKPAIRVFVSKPACVIAETILGLYCIMTIVVYLKRPWKILPRLPTNPATLIAYFAASHAVEDFRDTAHMTCLERARYLAKLDHRYGFGSFIGTDGNPHVGIEKGPYVVPLQAVEDTFSVCETEASETEKGWMLHRRFGWHSGNVREGGWI